MLSFDVHTVVRFSRIDLNCSIFGSTPCCSEQIQDNLRNRGLKSHKYSFQKAWALSLKRWG